MAEDWSAIAAEVADAIGDVGFASTLRRPGSALTSSPANPGPANPWEVDGIDESDVSADDDVGEPDPVDFSVTVVDDRRRIWGTLAGKSVRTLMVGATGVEPRKSDRIAVGVAPASVDGDTVFTTITEVRPLSPGGVNLMYECDLES